MASTNFFKKNAEGKDIYRTVACNGRSCVKKLDLQVFICYHHPPK